MDRNTVVLPMDDYNLVATREGGVDRNIYIILYIYYYMLSPPARVAWIETVQPIVIDKNNTVSPPARVAWIETGILTILNVST